jgi:hypothetical protein
MGRWPPSAPEVQERDFRGDIVEGVMVSTLTSAGAKKFPPFHLLREWL